MKASWAPDAESTLLLPAKTCRPSRTHVTTIFMSFTSLSTSAFSVHTINISQTESLSEPIYELQEGKWSVIQQGFKHGVHRDRMTLKWCPLHFSSWLLDHSKISNQLGIFAKARTVADYHKNILDSVDCAAWVRWNVLTIISRHSPQRPFPYSCT